MSGQTQSSPQEARKNFMELAKKLLAVPKKELDEKLAEFKTRPRKKRVAT